MKAFKPYLALSRIPNSTHKEVAVIVQTPGNYKQAGIVITTERNPRPTHDLIEIHFAPEPGYPAIKIEQNFVMPTDQGRDWVRVVVKLDLPPGGPRPDSGGGSSGHYGDPDD